MQNWYKPHPYGIYPRGNATGAEEIFERMGSLSPFVDATTYDDKERTELPFIELLQLLFSYLDVPDLCRLSRGCTALYVFVHCTDAFKNAYTLVSPKYLRFRGSWKETAVRGYAKVAAAAPEKKAATKASATAAPVSAMTPEALKKAETFSHTPVCVSRSVFCDQLFQSWMCTLLPPYYHLRPKSQGRRDTDDTAEEENPRGDAKGKKRARDAAWPSGAPQPSEEKPQYTSAFRPVQRCSGLSAEEFCARFEAPNIPVVLTDIATEWPLFKLLNGSFSNLAAKKKELVRQGCDTEAPLRCEYTNMSLEDYVHYAMEQRDERPIYMFDAEFGSVLDVEKLYEVPPHFARDDFFSAMGPARPKYRWIIAGPHRGGSSFHVDPNYTNAWNANLTGRKRWLLFPPGATPPGVVPSEDMSEVATPVSLTEWLLNNYDASVQQLRTRGYECICEPGDIMFVPCGWWHYVINLEDSIAITQNYVSRHNLAQVVKFLRTMRGSISGIDEDTESATEATTARRQRHFADEFIAAMKKTHPERMEEAEKKIEEERAEREKRRIGHLTLLDNSSEGFTFNF